MSLRQLRKLEKLKQQQQQEEAEGEDSHETDENETAVTIGGNEGAKGFSRFAGLIDSSSEEENVDQEPQEQPKSKPVDNDSKPDSGQSKKQKKKKNKKNRKRATKEANDTEGVEEVTKEKTDDEILQQAIEENKEQMKEMGINQQVESSVLRMYEKFFDSDREMKIKLQSRGIGSVDIDEEEVKAVGNNYDGLNRKQKKRMQQLEKMNKGKNAFRSSKKLIFVQPDPDWERYDIKHVYMESFRDDKDNKVFEFVEKQIYKEIQSEFRSIQQSYDISMMLNFLAKNFFHHETLIHVSDFLRMQGKFPDAVRLIKRCMYAFEVLLSKDFTVCTPKPNTRLNFNSDKSNLANIFADCLVRYIDHLGRKGCCRTALEFTKLFLSLDPENDPFGNLLKIDFYALRAGEYKYLANFCQRFTKEFYNTPLKTCLLAPNLLLSTAVAKFKLCNSKTPTLKACEDQLEKINDFMALIHEFAWEESPKILDTLYNFSAEGLLMLGLIFYPTLIKLLLIKVEAEKRPNPNFEEQTGHQLQPWAKIIQHELFEFDEGDEALETCLGLDSEVLNKYFDLYVDRTSECYKDDDLLDWMKFIIGFILNQIDQGNFERVYMFQFIFSTLGLPYDLQRYAFLSKEFFNDDFTTVAPQELLGQNQPPVGMNIGGRMNQAQMQQQFQAQLEQMIANNQVPPQAANIIRNNNARPPVDDDNLILEDPNLVMEQEAIMNHIAQQQQVEEEDILILDSGDAEVRKEEEDEE